MIQDCRFRMKLFLQFTGDERALFLSQYCYQTLHTEKCFVESTKIWLAQRNFSFKYGSMEILMESTKIILLIFFFFFQFQQKNFASSAKQWTCKLKLQNYCRIKKKILLVTVKLKKFCLNMGQQIFFLN